MGSDNYSSRPKRSKLRGYLSSGLLLLGSFLLPFVMLGILTSTRRLQDPRHSRAFADGIDRSGRPSSSKGRPVTKRSLSKGAFDAANPPAVLQQASLPFVMENLPAPCSGCPVVKSISPNTGPSATAVSITITGHNFGTTRTLRAVSIGSVPCISFEYVDASSITCQVPPGTGAELPVIVTVAASSGKKLRGASTSPEARWSYPVPKVRSVFPNHAPRSGGSTSVIIHGEGFGVSESYPVATIGGSACQSTKWISDSTVRCVVPPGAGVNLPVHVTVCGCGDASRSPQSTVNSGLSPVTFSYDEDVMKTSGRAIIHGMDLHPNRATPVMTNLNQLDTKYEIRFTNPVNKETVFYSVPPELAAVLPKADLSKRFDTCAVVGPAGSLAGTGFGDSIDAASAVFRVNNAPTHRYQADVGSKTTFQVINQFWTEMLMNGGEGPQDAKWWYEDATLVLTSPYSQESYILLRQLFPVSSIFFMSRNLVSIGTAISEKMRTRIQETMSASFGSVTEASSTFYATLMAIQVCNDVHLYGVDTRSGKFHYYDDTDEGDEERTHEGLEYLMYLVMQANGYIAGIHEAEAAQDEPSETAAQCTVRPCILSCNGRGKSVNNTCQCEPIYSGSDCSINLLASAANELLEDIELYYQGVLQMSRGAVNVTQINLPEGVTRGKLKEGDNYLVDRALYHALPEEDLTERYGSCAIVGNSGMLMNKELGREIDSHDMVYRFNQAPTRGYEAHVGARTTHESLNGAWVKALLDERRGFRWNWRSRDTSLVIFEMFEPAAFGWKSKTQIVEKDHWWRQSYIKLRKMYPDRKIISLNPHFVSWSYLWYRELRRRIHRHKLGRYPGEKPMSGIYAFIFLVQVCDELDMYGFQPWREDEKDREARYHYFDSAEPRPGSHSFDLARYLYQLVALKYEHVRIID